MSAWGGGGGFGGHFRGPGYGYPPPGFCPRGEPGGPFPADPQLGWFGHTQASDANFGAPAPGFAGRPAPGEFIPTMVWSNNVQSNTIPNGDWSNETNRNSSTGTVPKQHQQRQFGNHHQYGQQDNPYQQTTFYGQTGYQRQQYGGQEQQEEDYGRQAFQRLFGRGSKEQQYEGQFQAKYQEGEQQGPGGYHNGQEYQRHQQEQSDGQQIRQPSQQQAEGSGQFAGHWNRPEEGKPPPHRQAFGRTQRSGVDRLYRHPRHHHTDSNRNTATNNTVGHFGVEEKSEGRRKLLEEAAALLSDQNKIKQKNNINDKQQQSYSYWRNNNQKEAFNSTKKERESKIWRDKQDSVCQRERLEEQLRRGSLECLVCCERIRQSDRVWACSNCHHVLHLKCTAKWAATSKAETGWRCPACQNVTQKVPTEYKCMCGKVTDPQWVRGETPHCCGQVCSKNNNCIHQCTLLCHPGPCPPCSANTNRKCGCGRTSQTVQCSSSVPIVCESICGKKLNCTVHYCMEKCHNNPCQPCAVILQQECWCGVDKREVICDENSKGGERYACKNKCPGKLECGHHPCESECHEGPCGRCPLSPEEVRRCPCGRRPAPSERSSCLEPVWTCGGECGKALACSHPCQAECHLPPCPQCPLSTTQHCRCGRITQDTPCREITQALHCNKRCTKKRSCGKHKCNQNCCIDEDHICPLPCNKMLTCGRDRCQLLCHRGHCPPCSNVSFEELRCECGSEVVLPPVACGTRPPECQNPCPREHPCNHPPTHSCHSQPTCPPCTVLQAKHCHGKHELRKSVACHVGEFSCGRECGRKLECGHRCGALCHAGDCPQPCRRSCSTARGGCGHPCGIPCHHPSPCPRPPPPCPTTLRLSCPCGRRTASRACADHSAEYQRVATALLAQTMADVQLGHSVHPADLSTSASKISLKTLECNEDCKTYERNLRLAIGLQIVNPDLNSKLSPRYPDSMKAWAKRDPRLCQMVHEKLTQLVQLAKESKQKSRSYSFDPMNRDKRQFVHEYCKHFGCESVAYDTEPKRNIVATAYKDKCWLPSYSLLEVVQRENGQRKVPLPSLKKDTIKDTQMKPLQRSVLPQQPKQDKQPPEVDKQQETPIDYFDYTSSNN